MSFCRRHIVAVALLTIVVSGVLAAPAMARSFAPAAPPLAGLFDFLDPIFDAAVPQEVGHQRFRERTEQLRETTFVTSSAMFLGPSGRGMPCGSCAIPTGMRGERVEMRSARWAAFAGAVVIAVPLFLILLVLALFAGTAEVECGRSSDRLDVEHVTPPAGLTDRQRQLFSSPLEMEPGRWYRAGATNFYAGDGSGTGTRGAIPDADQSDLTRHPDTFAELSLKTTNAGVNYDTANALGRLPWMAAVRVAYRGRSVVVRKRDIGFGQGSGTIAGERFRIDLWGPAARALGVTSSLVQIQLLPSGGAGGTLGDVPSTTAGSVDAAAA